MTLLDTGAAALKNWSHPTMETTTAPSEALRQATEAARRDRSAGRYIDGLNRLITAADQALTDIETAK